MRVRTMLMAAVVAAAVPVSPALAGPPEIDPQPKVKFAPGRTCDFVPAPDGFTPMLRSGGKSKVECDVFGG